MNFGLDGEFKTIDFTTLRNNIIIKVKETIPSANLSTGTVLSQIVDIFTNILYDNYESLYNVYSQSYLNGATGQGLDNIAMIFGTVRKSATSTVVPKVKFVSTGAGTIASETLKLLFTSNIDYVFTNSEDIVFTSAGDVQYADVKCTVTGNININVNDTIVVQNSSLIASCNNIFSASTGADIETDATFKSRLKAKRMGTLSPTVLGANNILTLNLEKYHCNINIRTNRSDYTDTAGRPPHSMHVIIEDKSATDGNYLITSSTSNSVTINEVVKTIIVNDVVELAESPAINPIKRSVKYVSYTSTDTIVTFYDTFTLGSKTHLNIVKNNFPKDVAASIYYALPAGINLFGKNSINYISPYGSVATILYDTPTAVPIYANLQLIVTSGLTADEVSALSSTIIDWGNSLGYGKNVIIYGYNCLVAQLKNDKITDVTIQIGRTPSPVTDNNVIINDGTGGTELEYSKWLATNLTIGFSL